MTRPAQPKPLFPMWLILLWVVCLFTGLVVRFLVDPEVLQQWVRVGGVG